MSGAEKKGCTVPVRDWFQGERLERLERVLTASPGMAAWFDPAAVRQMIERQRQRSDRSGPLWALLNFALWHRIAAPPTRQDPFSYFR
ncbi:MAG: hypothetical protein IPL59_23915 [Candidatus Competibacteraceae bacterium]|nr:hypothetical protein [Candidatus Competibacteraceae bacterium]